MNKGRLWCRHWCLVFRCAFRIIHNNPTLKKIPNMIISKRHLQFWWQPPMSTPPGASPWLSLLTPRNFSGLSLPTEHTPNPCNPQHSNRYNPHPQPIHLGETMALSFHIASLQRCIFVSSWGWSQASESPPPSLWTLQLPYIISTSEQMLLCGCKEDKEASKSTL